MGVLRPLAEFHDAGDTGAVVETCGELSQLARSDGAGRGLAAEGRDPTPDLVQTYAWNVVTPYNADLYWTALRDISGGWASW